MKTIVLMPPCDIAEVSLETAAKLLRAAGEGPNHLVVSATVAQEFEDTVMDTPDEWDLVIVPDALLASPYSWALVGIEAAVVSVMPE